MNRRDFITLVGGSAAAWPLAARAQQPKMPVIGFLNSASADTYQSRMAAFRKGLSEAGYVEGQNVTIEYRWAEGRYDRLPTMAADLVRRRVTVIAASPTVAALAAKAATPTIPIVFAIGSDPVKFHLVSSLGRPGSNATGVIFFTIALGSKRLGLLHELVPKAASIGFLLNPSHPNAESDTKDMQAAASTLGLKLIVVTASIESEIDVAFATLVQARAEALVVNADSFFTSRRVQIVTLAARHAIPTIYAGGEFPAVGGLMSYSSDVADAHRQMGVYTGRIIQGTRPTDLPVTQPTKIAFVINRQTAKSLGLTIPDKLIAIADEVIE